ncbi:MAG: hypothetical protein EOM55_00650 [Clostridia bacterium]|nr:hypothetical protein [Clostridia bacterium]
MKKHNFKKLNKFKGFFLSFIFCFILPFFSFYAINEFVLKPSTFASGTSLCGVDIGNLSIDKAKEKILTNQKQDDSISLSIVFGDKKWTFTEKDFETKSSIHTVLDEMQKSHRRGVSSKRLIKKIKKMGFSDETATTYTLIGIDEKIDNIASEIETEPVCAKAVFSKNSYSISPSKQGSKLNKEKLYNDITLSISSGFSIVTVSTCPIKPQFVEEDIVKATKLQGEFSTKYSSSSYGRKNNINLATQALNNTEILPNEIFSFNDIVGRRTLDKGYKTANIIKDGTFVKGVGGGICQVSTTLYNALLLSNINVDESHKHSLPVSYVKPGLDAMVSWNGADLKFKNTTSLPIYISSNSNNESINFKIYGDTNPENLAIKTKSEIIKKIPAIKDKVIPDKDGKYAEKIMFKGEFIREKSSKDGYEVQTFLEYYKNDELISSKPLRHATYEPQQGIVYEGCESLPKSLTLPKNKHTEPED